MEDYHISEDVFEDDYGPDVIDDEEEDGETQDETEEDEEDARRTPGLGISARHARMNYERAGTRMPEEPEKFKIEDFKDHMNAAAEKALDDLEEELDLPYKSAPYQRVAISCAANGESVVLVVPCGSGKTDVALKGARVLRKTSGDPLGITVVTQPLTALQQEKMDNPIAGVAVLSMTEELTMMGETEDGEKAILSCSLENLLAGKFEILLGHPESFDTPLGRTILLELQRLNRIQMIVIDEFHQGGDGHWSSFRPVDIHPCSCLVCRLIFFCRIC